MKRRFVKLFLEYNFELDILLNKILIDKFV